MSDADDGGFDKEAEREKLREKYEEDQQKRESTQRMSELLLQGATMTNQHCDSCGSPRFRYEGNTFCPSCEGEENAETRTGPRGEQAAGEVENETGEAEPGQAPSGEEAEASEPSAGTEANAGQTQPAEPETPTAPRSETTPQTETTPERAREPEPTRTPNQPRESETGQRTTSPQPTETGSPARTSEGTANDLSAARASVRATLNDLAARAERSNDAAHTRELLAATKEAAQTLRELNRLE